MASIHDLYTVSRALQGNGRDRIYNQLANEIINKMIEKAQEKARKAAQKRAAMSEEERAALNAKRREKEHAKNEEIRLRVYNAIEANINKEPTTAAALYNRILDNDPEFHYVILSPQSFAQRLSSDCNVYINPKYIHKINGLNNYLYYKEG